MAVNEIYGAPSSWYTIPRTFDSLKIANFTSSAGSLANARVAIAMTAGSIQPGTLLDSSVCTHAIPATLEGRHAWNTMFDVGGINVKGGSDNCILNKHYGNSVGIIYRVNSRSSTSTDTSLAPYLNNSISYNSPQTDVSDNWDINRMCPVTQIDFKRFVFAIVLQVCTNFETELDSEGIKRRTDSTSVPNSIMIDLQTWLSDMKYSNTETFHDHYPHICTVHLVPLYQMYGSTAVWNNFTAAVDADHRLACIPNMNFDYTCSGWNQSANRCTAANTGTSVLTNAVNWMDNQPISGQSIRYTMDNGTQTNTMNIGDMPCTLFTIFGMNGGNGGSSGIIVYCDINSNNRRYQVKTVRGFSHLDWAYVGSESNSSRGIFAWWKDQPEYPTPADPTNPTEEEQEAIVEWKKKIRGIIYTMVAYTGAVFQESVNGLNQNPEARLIGEIDENGIATGVIKAITEETFEDFPQTASDNFIDDTPYDPGKVPDDYDYNSEIGVKNIQTGNVFCRAYAVNNEVKGLSQYLWNTITDAVAAAEAYPVAQKELSSKFLTTNPIDNIVSLIYYPFNIRDQLGLSSLRAVGLGNQTVTYAIPGSSEALTMEGYLIGYNMQVLLDAGSLDLQPYFNDFRDYEPYTTIELFIPYHGSIALLSSEVLGHMLSVKIAVDLLTGSSTAFIFRDNLIIDQINGNMGVNIPINGLEQATYNANIYNANSSLKIAKANEQLTNISPGFQIAGGITGALAQGAMAYGAGANGNIPVAVGLGLGAVGSLVGAAGTGFTSNLKSDIAAQQVANAQFNLDHTTKPIKNCGAPTGSNSTVGEQYCRLIIRRPYIVTRPGTDVQADYADNVGFAQYTMVGPSDDQTHLGIFSGHIEMTNVKVNGNMTSKEKELIKTALMNGIHIK